MKEPGHLWSRGYLPHIDESGTIQFVTFRLEDALNPNSLQLWRDEFAALPDRERSAAMRDRVEQALDEGHGSRLLANPVAARIVFESILYANENFCTVIAFVVMPTHVHLLMSDHRLDIGDIVKRIKTYTALNIHRALGMASGRLWQPEYYDTIIRDEDHCRRTVEYIEWNPVKGRLCSDPKAFPYSSANPKVQSRLLSNSRAGGSLERRAGDPRS